MKSPRYGGSAEYVYGTRYSGEALGQFVFANMPPEAKEAINARVVTPTTEEFLRLADIELEGLPRLTIKELIGPTTIGELDSSAQAFYFSGPHHPILVKARYLPTFVTYSDMLRVHGDLGIRRTEVVRNFKGLVKNLFEDDEITTFGDPDMYKFEKKDSAGVEMLHRFAVRRSVAQLAMKGDYQVKISGARDANVFNGYGRTLMRAVYGTSEDIQHMELSTELESIPDLVVDPEDPKRFRWGKVYKDSTGIGYVMNSHSIFDTTIIPYIEDLLREIYVGNEDLRKAAMNISEQVFVMTTDALCPLDKYHTQSTKNGHTCGQGIHYQGLSKEVVQRAKSIAICIAESRSVAKETNPDKNEDEINLRDPDLQASTPRSRPKTATADFDW